MEKILNICALSLQVLNIANNDLDGYDIAAIAKSLRHCFGLKQLFIGHPDKDYKGHMTSIDKKRPVTKNKKGQGVANRPGCIGLNILSQLYLPELEMLCLGDCGISDNDHHHEIGTICKKLLSRGPMKKNLNEQSSSSTSKISNEQEQNPKRFEVRLNLDNNPHVGPNILSEIRLSYKNIKDENEEEKKTLAHLSFVNCEDIEPDQYIIPEYYSTRPDYGWLSIWRLFQQEELKSLDISGTNKNGDDSDFLVHSNFGTCCMGLQSLSLRSVFKFRSPDDFLYIGSLTYVENLRYLDLTDNKFDRGFVYDLACLFYLPNLEQLHLCSNPIGSNGLWDLKIILEDRMAIKEWRGHQPYTKAGKHLTSKYDRLMARAYRSLEIPSKLEYLGLSSCRIDNRYVDEFLEVLENFPNFKKLSLSDNYIQNLTYDKDAVPSSDSDPKNYLGLDVNQNYTIQRTHNSFTVVESETIRRPAPTHKFFGGLHYLNLKGNRIPCQNVKEIERMLAYNREVDERKDLLNLRQKIFEKQGQGRRLANQRTVNMPYGI